MAIRKPSEDRHLSQAAGFLGACFSRAQHRTAEVEAAAGGMWAGSGGSPVRTSWVRRRPTYEVTASRDLV
jgi:hypothetical protein